MKKAIEWLKGKKTYFVLGAAAGIWYMEAIGLLPAGSLQNSIPILAIAGGATITAKLNRMIGG